MYNVLVLEDDFNRLRVFEKHLSKLLDTKIYYFLDARDAIDFINSNPTIIIDEMYLDHDLGGEIFVDVNEENTGSYFVKFMKEKNIKVKYVVIHSMNPAGVNNMRDILESYNGVTNKLYTIPFNMLWN